MSELQRDMVAVSLSLWKATIVVITILTSTFSYLAAVDAQSAKCAGSAWVAGYRSGISDFVAFPLICAVAAVLFIVVATADKAKKYALWDEREVFVLGRIRITFGMFVLAFTLACGVGAFGVPAVFSVARYIAISDQCVSAALH